ncbi:MAG: DUF2059 domain-containing protein [Candidatus Omnitrophica bacterium]|nr:DUF2059 domain-containing protein [Candidatus Omnitrophota bacterium]
MKDKLLVVVFLLISIATPARAETIYLKDGRVVTGKIINRGAADVTIKEGGAPRHYFSDQILRIEQDDAPVSLAAPADPAPKPVVSAEKVVLITEFIEVSGIRQSIQAIIDRIIAQSPPEKQTELKSVFDMQGIMRELMPIYDKYYSSEELKEISAFYRTPAGQKMIEVTPKIMNEFLQASVDAIKQRPKP